MINETMQKLVREDCRISCTEPEVFSILRNQEILMTGGTGFMGKWIAEMIAYLNETQQLNIQLHLLGRDVERFKNEVPHLASMSYIHVFEQDVRNLHDLSNKINYIIHAAGTPDNREHVSQPIRTVETFYRGTQCVLDAATRVPDLKKIVHISSHQVYGSNEQEQSLKEDFNGKLDLVNVYTESKRITEVLCSVYRNQFRLPIVILRPFALIGPYHDLEKPWAINNFIRDGILGGPIRILGNGATVRSYLYSSDMAYWILKTLVIGKTGAAYNLGSSEAITLADLATKVKKLLGSDVEILSKSSKENYVNSSKLVPNITKITKEIGVNETHSLEESIKKTIVWNQLIRK